MCEFWKCCQASANVCKHSACNAQAHVPYRNSKLTSLLENSLKGAPPVASGGGWMHVTVPVATTKTMSQSCTRRSGARTKYSTLAFSRLCCSGRPGSSKTLMLVHCRPNLEHTGETVRPTQPYHAYQAVEVGVHAQYDSWFADPHPCADLRVEFRNACAYGGTWSSRSCGTQLAKHALMWSHYRRFIIIFV